MEWLPFSTRKDQRTEQEWVNSRSFPHRQFGSDQIVGEARSYVRKAGFRKVHSFLATQAREATEKRTFREVGDQVRTRWISALGTPGSNKKTAGTLLTVPSTRSVLSTMCDCPFTTQEHSKKSRTNRIGLRRPLKIGWLR